MDAARVLPLARIRTITATTVLLVWNFPVQALDGQFPGALSLLSETSLLRLQGGWSPAPMAIERGGALFQPGRLGITPSLSLGAYYRDNGDQAFSLPTGSRFGPGGDLFPVGEGSAGIAPATAIHQLESASRDGDDWGVSASYRARPWRTEFNLYWLHFHEKQGSGHYRPAGTEAMDSQTPTQPETVRLLGASFATALAKGSLGGEVQVRRNTPQAERQDSLPDRTGEDQAKSFHSLGNTVQTRLSATYNLPATSLWDSGTVLLSVGRQRRTGVTSNAATIDPTLNRDARSVALLFAPSWTEALPNLNLTLPLSLSYTAKGRAPLPGFEGRYRGARLNLGVSMVYQKTWNADLRYTHFFQDDTNENGRKDRNFIWFSLQHSF